MVHLADAAPPKIDPMCQKILDEEKLDVGALANDTNAATPRVHCSSIASGTWALRVDPPEAGRAVRQTLVFARQDGTRARQVSILPDVEWPPALGRHTAMFDFDGDGSPEYFAIVPKDVKTFSPAVRNLVTYKNGKIAPYPVEKGYSVDGVADLDLDGRGDLKISYELGKRTACDPGEQGTSVTVELSAHGQAGGKFSVDDDGAAAYAAKKCPSMPAADAMFDPSMNLKADPKDLSLSWVLCSRLRGKSADAVIAELQAACAAHADKTKQCLGPCRHLPDAIAVAKFTPPVKAKDPPGAVGSEPNKD